MEQQVKITFETLDSFVAKSRNKNRRYKGPHCSRCGQPLKDPLSIELGIGPYCRHKEVKMIFHIPAGKSLD